MYTRLLVYVLYCKFITYRRFGVRNRELESVWNNSTSSSFGGFVLEELLGAELEDVVELLLAHRHRAAAHSRAHNQVREHHLAARHLKDALLHCVTSHKPVDKHAIRLPDAVRAAERLLNYIQSFKANIFIQKFSSSNVKNLQKQTWISLCGFQSES